MNRPLGSKYLLDEPLGRGASGTVWRGRVRDTGEAVAVKVLHEELASDPDVVTRFLRERALLLKLRHPNLVTVRDLVVEGEMLALVMELVEGPDLRGHLRVEERLEPAEAARIMSGVLNALVATHAAGVVHRDLKPANVLLRETADGLHPLLSDFGIARLADGSQLTRTNEFLGTPQYVPPEIALGAKPTPAVDVYAAGILLYELLSGRPPFNDDNPLAVLRQHIELTPQRPPGIPDLMWLLVRDCLHKKPEDRPAAPDVARRLARIADPDLGQTLVTGAGQGAGAATAAEGATRSFGDDPAGATRSFDEGRTQQAGTHGGPGTDAPTAVTPTGATAVNPADAPTSVTPAAAAGQPHPAQPPRTRLYQSSPSTRRTYQSGRQAQQPPQSARPPQQTARQATPPPRQYAPPPQAAPPARQPAPRAPKPSKPPKQPKTPKQKRSGRLLPRIPGLGCLFKLAVLAALLVVGYAYFVEGTPVGDLIDFVIRNGPELFDRLQEAANRGSG